MIPLNPSKKFPPMKNETDSSKLIVMSGGGKGGVGKTLTISGIADFYRSNGIQPVMFDCDTENKTRGSLSHFFGDAPKLDIRNERGMDRFIDSVLTTPSRIVLADLGAGSGRDTFAWFDSMHAELAGMGIRFTAAITITSSSSSVETIFNWAEALGPRVQYLVVRNRVMGDDFGYFDQTGPGRAFIAKARPAVIDLERRAIEIQAELENRGLTARQALEAPADRRGDLLGGASARIRMQGYAHRFEKALLGVKEILLP